MKAVLAVVGVWGCIATATALPLPGGVSPDGNHVISLEPAPPTAGPTSVGQILQIHQAGAFPLASTVGTGHLEDPVTLADRPRIDWNPTSSFFVFSFRRGNRIIGQIVTLRTGAAGATGTFGGIRTAYLSDVAGPEQIVAYKLIGTRGLWMKTITLSGQGTEYTLTIHPDGSVKAVAYRR